MSRLSIQILRNTIALFLQSMLGRLRSCKKERSRLKGVATVQGRAIRVQLKLMYVKIGKNRRIAEREAVSTLSRMFGSALTS